MNFGRKASRLGSMAGAGRGCSGAWAPEPLGTFCGKLGLILDCGIRERYKEGGQSSLGGKRSGISGVRFLFPPRGMEVTHRAPRTWWPPPFRPRSGRWAHPSVQVD